MTGPKLSVLLVTYNHARFIERALASISSQQFSDSMEIVVADDASSDETAALIRAWSETADFEVRFLESLPRLGITQNYHRGFSACSGTYIAVLEGDDEWVSIEKLRLQVELLDSHPQLAMAATRILLYDDATGSSSVLPLIGLDAMHVEVTTRQLADSNWFATFSGCMYRAEVLERLAPEIFETTAYDWLINMAVTEYGNAGLLAEVATLYRIHQDGQWSRTAQRDRDEQIRSLLPRYIELVGANVGHELTRYMHALDSRMTQSVDMPEAAAAVAEETAVHLPIARVTSSRRPRVSVVMPCYNHEDFIVAAINSVLDQTMDDFELIIVDDGSADASMAAVATLSDPRMRVYRLSQNQGAAAALNFAIQQTRAAHVAVINSDDMWERHKLERQLEVFAADPSIGAVFTGARFVDEAGAPLPAERIPRWNDVFRQPNRTQAQWLRFFFEHGNALCHPSVLIRREFYEKFGLYDNRMRQVPDYARWIALVKHYRIVVLGNEDLVRFRLLATEQNASSGARSNVVRGLHEHVAINETFFDGCSNELIVEAFIDLLRYPYLAHEDERECELAFLWWDTECPMREVNRIHAQRLLRSLLGRPDSARLLLTRYGFSDLSMHEYACHEQAFAPPLAGWLHDLEGMNAPVHDRIGDLQVGELLRVVMSRARHTRLTTWPRRGIYHLRRAAAPR